MSCKKINIGTWATPLKTRSNYSVGEMQFSHINWASSIEINAKITVMSSNDINKFQKELEALLTKYHCENIWQRNQNANHQKPNLKALYRKLSEVPNEIQKTQARTRARRRKFKDSVHCIFRYSYLVVLD